MTKVQFKELVFFSTLKNSQKQPLTQSQGMKTLLQFNSQHTDSEIFRAETYLLTG